MFNELLLDEYGFVTASQRPNGGHRPFLEPRRGGVNRLHAEVRREPLNDGKR